VVLEGLEAGKGSTSSENLVAERSLVVVVVIVDLVVRIVRFAWFKQASA